MSVGFGFSVGDLVTGLKILKDSVEAVKDTKGASADYTALLAEISSLQDAFEAIDDLQLGSRGTPKQRLAIERAIGACQKCVEDFMTSISKYQPHLQTQTTGLISSYRKIRWALCKKEDVALFRTKLERHTSSINMLLLSLQAHEQARASVVQGNTSSVVTPPDHMRDRHTNDLLQNLSVEQRQCFEILMQQNKELMRNVRDLHRMLQMHMAIPPQVLLQQPVILLDAFGKIAPFHLEFIDSLETFTAVLKIRFRKAGVKLPGLAKVDNREYTIQETRDKRPIDVEKPWSEVFRPGHEVDMSMVFHRFACPPSKCPGCSKNNENGEEQVQCQGCGLCYQNIIPSRFKEFPNLAGTLDRNRTIYLQMVQRPSTWTFLGKSPPTEIAEDTSFDGYRRVQVISQSSSLIHTDEVSSNPFGPFSEFVDFFSSVKEERLPYLLDLRQLNLRIRDHSRRYLDIPLFSSPLVKEWEQKMIDRSSLLKQDIVQLVEIILDDEKSIILLDYIFTNHPSQRTSPNIYTKLLATSFKNLSNKLETNTDTADENPRRTGINPNPNPSSRVRVKSKDPVQWILLNSKGN